MSWVVSILILLGAFFGVVAAIGVLRFPDFFLRMHAATKAGAFGAALMMLAAAFYFGTPRAVVTSILIIVFYYLTTPVAAQALSEAAYRCGTKLWDKSGVNKLEESGELDRVEEQDPSA